MLKITNVCRHPKITRDIPQWYTCTYYHIGRCFYNFAFEVPMLGAAIIAFFVEDSQKY